VEKLLFGVEIEWFHAHLGSRPVGAEQVAAATLAAIREAGHWLPDTGAGMFLPTGRVYPDCGHCEFASNECSSPAELVANIKAFERVLTGITPRVAELLGGGRTIFARLNVDHRSASFGTHLSVLTRHPPEYYARPLIPYLVAKTVIAGEGGPGPEGSRLVVSPRMLHIGCVSGIDTVQVKPIFNTRDEPHAGGGDQGTTVRRLHATCFSTLSSELGWYLTVGFSAAVIRAVELGGVDIADRLRLADPVKAMHAVASDLTCREPLKLAGGGQTTAVRILREYLAIVTRYLARLPAWAADVCGRLEEMLDKLADDPSRLVGLLDWPTKAEIFRQHQLQPDDRSDGILRQLYSAVKRTAYGARRPPLEVLLGPNSPVLETVAMLNLELERRGLRWEDCRPEQAGRLRLAEMDIRFATLGDGVFDELNRRGLLRHAVVDESDIERAWREGPNTRARLRAASVRRMAGSTDFAATWRGVYDLRRGRVLDLRDPFETSEKWVPTSEFDGVEHTMPRRLVSLLEGIVR
jgi:hypothetical protein